MNNDPSKLRERLAYHMFRQFGVPAPRAVHATLTVNGESLGLYSLVEQVDGRFARARFADGGDGNIYKERWPTSSEDPEYFRSGLETNEDDPEVDVSTAVAFAQAVRAAAPEELEGVLREYTDFDALMRYVAVDRAIENWDGITAFRCQPDEDVPPLPPAVAEAQRPPLGWSTCQNKNFYWYEATEPRRLWLVAWDTDISFPLIPSQFPPWDEPPTECKIQQRGRPPMCDPLIAAFSTTLRPHFVEAGEELLRDVFRPELLGPLIDTWLEQISPHLGSRDFLARRPEVLVNQVAECRTAFEEQLAR
jgi:spore coat protein H